MDSGPDQIRLLKLQGLDSRLGQLRAARQNDPSIGVVAEYEKRLSALRKSMIAAQTATSDLQRETDKVQSFIDEATGRITRNQAKIDAGDLNHKDALAISEEMSSLVKRVSELEEDLLEVLERQEACLATEGQVDEAVKSMMSALSEAEANRDQALANIVMEGRAVVGERDSLAGQIAPELLKRYEGIRARVGSGAARYWGGKCEGCGLVLPPSEQETVAKANPDQVVTCEECGRILVRVPQ